MKLIVLYGDENSGKTTSLKMAYEQLKKVNLVETRCFKYYDEDRGHLDFRDILILNKDEFVNAGLGNNQDPLFQMYGINSVQNQFPNNNIHQKFTLGSNDVNVNSIQFDSYVCHILKQLNVEHKKVGFILEGDFGFEPKSNQQLPHNRYLYKHLKQMMFCDIVICACSIIYDDDKKLITKPIQLPINCLVKFIDDYSSKITNFSVIKTTMFPSGTNYMNKLSKEKDIMEKILYHLSQML